MTGADSEFQTTNVFGSDSKKVLTKIADQPEAAKLKYQALMTFNTRSTFPRKLSLSRKVSPLTLPMNVEASRSFIQQASPRTLNAAQLNCQGRPLPFRGGGGSLPHGPRTVTHSFGKLGKTSESRGPAGIYKESLDQFKKKLTVQHSNLMMNEMQMHTTRLNATQNLTPFT